MEINKVKIVKFILTEWMAVLIVFIVDEHCIDVHLIPAYNVKTKIQCEYFCAGTAFKSHH